MKSLRDPESAEHACSDELHAIPLRDRCLFAAAERILVLKSRASGHVSRLRQLHATDAERAVVPVEDARPILTVSRESGRPGQRQDRSPAVAGFWREALMPGVMVGASDGGVRPFKGPLTHPCQWLLHWTRSCPGPWPGQSRRDWLDELILGRPEADHSAVSTLTRILREQRVRGSSLGIRGGSLVVSWTAVPLSEFPGRRCFRSHRQRFDFEPWGLGVRRRVLLERGARRVEYGPESLWKQLPEADRPYYQKVSALASSPACGTESEREWRTLGDFSLALLAESDVCVFVPAETERCLPAECCRWPIVAVPAAVDRFPDRD